MNKLEQLSHADIKAMSHAELCGLLRNYGVLLKDHGVDYAIEKLLASALALKKKSDEKLAQISKNEEPQDPAPDLTKEEKEEPVKSLYALGYNSRESLISDLQALKRTKKDLDLKEQEIEEKAKVIFEEGAKLDAKKVQIEIQRSRLEQESKTYKEAHDRLVAAKKS